MLLSWRGLLLGCPVPPVHVLAAVYSSLEPQLRVAIPSTALWANQQPLLAQPACPLISTAARFASSSTGAEQRDGTSVSPAVPTKAERRAAAAQFSRQRAAWRRSVGALRMQWMAEHRDAVAALTASERAQKEQLKALQQLRSESKPAEQAQADLERAIRDAERDVLLVRSSALCLCLVLLHAANHGQNGALHISSHVVYSMVRHSIA